ncbi:hypothetical protein GGS23DRAFT_508764 [Durotheca rogersii]|uniref:uncharacterized protein n=1 Tax=Durotheca rogersii TaxID=419775 RepID=UPI0022211AD3|nr:uncharacterized protein GGS23DRAFT_508764 [Durotheca rogersii]KAI5863650.1 hypothetical protein GGS23DRAFT_508764 [Durotheca rogersii]
MLLANSFVALGWAAVWGAAAATIPSSDISVSVRDMPGASSAYTLQALGRSLRRLQSQKRDTIFKNSTSLEKSWDGATLLSMTTQTESAGVSVAGGVDITCTTCYIRGLATAEFSVDSKFNVSNAVRNFTGEIREEVLNTTDAAIDYVQSYFSGVLANLQDGIDLDDFDFPPLDIDFNVDIPDIPECRLKFQFDNLELYMLVDTVLTAGATYNLNLFSSNTPIGVAANSDLFIGVIFSVDLILSVDTEIDISSGIHILLEDGVGLDMALFGKNVSSITFNGANFEFLPVTVESAGGLIKAVLRIGVNAGFEIETPRVTIPSVGFATKASAGVAVRVWADVAEFATNITAVPDAGDGECALVMEQTYQFGLGAAAGATLAIGAETWGPAPETNIPIFYTTIADLCATKGRGVATTAVTASSGSTTVSVSGSASASASVDTNVAASSGSGVTALPSAVLTARADGDGELTTTTLTKKVTFVGIACLTTGLVNCPLSAQTTTKVTSTLTHVTAVPSGADEPVFPESVATTVASPVPFGPGAVKVAATTGAPASYVPPPPPASSTEGDGAAATADEITSTDQPLGTVNGVDTRLIIGLSVGLGVPVLAGIASVIYFYRGRKRYAPVAKIEDPTHLGAPRPYGGAGRH